MKNDIEQTLKERIAEYRRFVELNRTAEEQFLKEARKAAAKAEWNQGMLKMYEDRLSSLMAKSQKAGA
jgi:hypothetical protein